MKEKDSVTRVVRSCCADDLDAVTLIWLTGNLDAHSFISADYWRAAVPFVRKALTQSEVYVCADARSREILGFVGMSGEFLEGIFTRAEYRSQGVGRALLDCVKETRTKIVLKVYQQNEKALRFYLREGFERSAEGIDVATGAAEATLVWRRE